MWRQKEEIEKIIKEKGSEGKEINRRQKKGKRGKERRREKEIMWRQKRKEKREMRVKGRQKAGNTKGGSITVLLTSCLTGLE
jgi:hypothetical protein